jgi:hypothetical protein
MDSPGLEQDMVMGSCEYDNEPLASIKGMEFLDQVHHLVSYDAISRNKVSIRQLSLLFLPAHYMFPGYMGLEYKYILPP